MMRPTWRLTLVFAFGCLLACRQQPPGASAPTRQERALVSAGPVPAHAAAALAWLSTQQNPDGSYGDRPTSLATAAQSTVEALRGRLAFSDASGPEVAAAAAYLRANSEPSTQYLASAILVEADLGADERLGGLLASLLPHRNPDGGFGVAPGEASTVLDTALALQALHAAGRPPGSAEVGAAVSWLRARQGPGGGFNDGANDPSSFVTAAALGALAPYRASFSGLGAAVTAAQGFLLARRGPDQLWGEDFVSAAALLALLPVVPEITLVEPSEAALRARQDGAGSWVQDAYTTGLALRAFAAFEARRTPTGPGVGTVAGHVVSAGSTEPVAGATVTIEQLPGTAVASNGDGYFLLPGTPPGSYTLTASKVGYASASAAVTVEAGKVTVADRLVLEVLGDSGLVKGLVFDAATRQPLSGVQITLGGPAGRSVVSDAVGEFAFGPTAPGAQTLELRKAGYRTLTGQATVTAGETLVLQVGLTAAGGFEDPAPGTLRGRVVDGRTGQALPGARVDLGGGRTGTSAPDGAFAVAEVPRGSHDGTVQAAGYKTIRFTVVFPAGASGELGTLELFPADPTEPPRTLRLVGRVVDGVSGAAVPAAAVVLTETGAAATSGPDGGFELGGIEVKRFTLAVTAAGYAPASFAVEVAAFGEASIVLRLSPPGNGATTTSLTGVVTDAQTGAPVAGASVALLGTALTTSTGADGRYQLTGIDRLELAVSVSAVGYAPLSAEVKLTAHGDFTFNPALTPVPVDTFQVLSVNAEAPEWGASTVARFQVRVASLLGADKTVLLLGDVRDASGATVATVTPYAAGTTSPTASFTFAPGETLALVVPWNTAQFPAGAYRLVLRVVEPGTVTLGNPLGQVLAENGGGTKLVPTRALEGALALSPPLSQAGLPTPVAFTALLRNAGNVPLGGEALVLTVSDPASGATLFTSERQAPALAVGANQSLDFGSWVPTVAGNLTVKVQAREAGLAGVLSERLYVGDKAAGTFTVDRQVVPEGTQTVRGRIELAGVDVSQGSSTDPLFALVKEAVRRGGAYTAPNALAWHRTNRCLGCHIQTQSLLGLSSALDKAEIDRPATDFLYNSVVSSLRSDGSLRISHPEFTRTQTTLGLWSLEAWPDPAAAFRTKYRAAQALLGWKVRSGTISRWVPDHATGWWTTDVSHTALTLKAFADVVEQAAILDLAALPDYRAAARFTLPGGAIVDLAAGPAGKLYAATAGAVSAVDVGSGAITPVATITGANVRGLTVAPDGTVYLARGAAPQLVRIRPDGTREDLAVPSTGAALDVALGPDGWLYYCDSAVRRRSPTGVVEIVASGGLVSQPNGLAFDAAGNLLVANLNGYNILKIAPDRTVSVYADGLAFRPRRLALSEAGDAFVTTETSVLKIRADGLAEAVLPDSNQNGVAIVGGQPLVAAAASGVVQAVETTSLGGISVATLRDEIPFAVRHLLAGHRDNSSDNTFHALRLIGLAEARPILTDPGQKAEIEAAITLIETLLRARQKANGGWSRSQPSSQSDPLTTALVGIALEYNEPSPDDPQIRRTIQYLLNTQLADGSWDNFGSGLTTRLASTSFVMIFMPKALERLGGIDIDLHVDLPASVRLANPSVAPTSTTPSADGGTAYVWVLKGVTGAGRTVEADLTLQDMQLGERRPVARRTFLSFTNSFIDEKIELPLEIPVVSTLADLGLTVATDQPSYQPHQRAALLATVKNLGPTAGAGEVRLAIHPAGNDLAVAELAPLPFADLDPGASLARSAEWDTGATLAGPYELRGRLFDGRGRLLAVTSAPFQIVAPATLATTTVTTDRPVYDAFDLVRFTGRVRNAAPNVLLAPTRAELTVETPTGQTILSETFAVPQLAPLALFDVQASKALADASGGIYPVTLRLRDAFTQELLSTSTTSFEVRVQAGQGIAGSVDVDAVQVDRGVGNRCHERVRNLAAQPVAGLRLVRRLVALDSGATVSQAAETVDLPGGGERAFLTEIDTAPLVAGEYACLLLAEEGGTERTLASAGFRVVEAPVRVSAQATIGGAGRLLVLLDRPSSQPSKDGDPNGPSAAPTLTRQREALRSLLTRESWSFTLTESADAFTRELRTGGYTSYALFAEKEKLSEQAQQELREAIFRGEGLLVAGDHDSRHGKVHHALGLKYLGRQGASQVTPRTAGSPVAGAFRLLPDEKPLRIRRRTAESLAVYGTDPRSKSCDPDAITFNPYGRGRAAFAGPDLLALATRDNLTGPAATTLRNLLERIRPAETAPRAGAVVPVKVVVTNPGSAAPVQVAVAMPAGAAVVDPTTGQASGGTVTFDFALGAGESRTSTLWLRLPASAGMVTVVATVRAGSGPGAATVTASATVTVVAPESLGALRTRLDTLAREDQRNRSALRQASEAVGKALGSSADQAIKQVIKASEALLDVTTSPVVEVRVGLGVWLHRALQPSR